MNKEQRKELKRLAAEATPGPWIAAGPSFGGPMPVYCNDVCVDREGDDDDTYSVFGAPIGMDKEASSDMEYIAAANPKAITALLSALEAAEAENERLRKAVEDVLAWRVNEPCRGDLRDNDKSRDALSALVKAMEAK